MAVQFRAFIFRADGEPPIGAVTRNISVDGFYCVAEQMLSSGEEVCCLVIIPDGGGLNLRCRARVLRVDLIEERTPTGGQFGAACSIKDYQAVPEESESSAGCLKPT